MRHIAFFILSLMLHVSQAVWAPGATALQQELEEGANLLRQGRAEDALVILHEVAERTPDPTQLHPLLASAYLVLGHNRLRQGDDPGARAAFETGRQYAPDDYRLLHGTAFAWFREGQYAMAVYELQEALVLAGDRPDLLTLLGQAQYAQGDLWQAITSWEQARALERTDELDRLIAKARKEQEIEAEMRQDVRGHFTLSFVEGAHGTMAAEVLDVLIEAYNEIGSDLGFYPETEVPVLLYTGTDFSAVTRSPDWAGAMYDGKIRIPLGGVDRMTDRLRALLYHEYAHVVVRFMANNRAPAWLNEGIAEIYERRILDPPLSALTTAARNGTFLDLDQLGGSFQGLPKEQVRLAYEQSYSLVAYLVDRHGWYGLAAVLRAIGRGMTPRQAFDSSLYGQGWLAFYADWKTQLGP